MKRPSFQFYPADWQTDNSLRACSLAARGLWMEMICIMHQADPYGYFLLNQKPIQNSTLARMVGCSLEETESLLDELESNGVFVRDENGTIYSKRMVKDEYIRQVRATAGKKGGNPNLKQGKKGQNAASDELDLLNQNANQTGKQNPTPSSSSSSTGSNTTTPLAREDSGQSDSEGQDPTDIPDIPTKQSHWIVFFQRQGYNFWDIKKKPDVLRAIDDWIEKAVSTELVTLVIQEVEAKKGRVDISYYLPKVADRIRMRDSPPMHNQSNPGRRNGRPQKFSGFDYINQNRKQPNGQYAGNTFDGEYRPVEPGE